ncbi:MAG: flagellar protein FliL [Hyphomicrobiales bacterium]|jgi:flagellar FliL protein|nr:flagellar protein FliL [Hyphomicrobiales bacterium]
MAKTKKAEEEEKEAPAEGAEGEAAPKKGFFSKKLVIMAAAGLLMLGGAGSGAWFFFGKKPHDEKPAPVAAKPPAFVDMPDVLVNLSGAVNGRAQYLKAKIVLEVADQKIAEEIKPVLPRVLDSFQTYLREMRPTDLEGSAGLYRVRDELTRRVNLAVAPSRINAVLFKEIVVQ